MIRVVDTDGDEFYFHVHDVRRCTVVHNDDDAKNPHSVRMYFYDEAEISIALDDEEYRKLCCDALIKEQREPMPGDL